VEEVAEEFGSNLTFECDVSKDEHIKALREWLEKNWGSLDIIVHSIAYAPKEEFKGGVIDTSREGFKIAMDISVYSLIALTRELLPLMEGRNGSIITLSYYGAEKVVPHYNVMGIAKAALECTVRYLAYDIAKHGHRINAISAGPVKTLAAYSITGFHLLMEHTIKVNPFGRAITIEEVGDTAVFLCSDWARAITGELSMWIMAITLWASLVEKKRSKRKFSVKVNEKMVSYPTVGFALGLSDLVLFTS
jgi:enoyl-[acyl-carrier protein] reductase I